MKTNFKKMLELLSLNDTLNLNCAFVGMPDLRKVALTTLQQEINSRYPGRSAPKEYFLRLLEKFQNENESKRPYVGILTYWLKKKVGER